MRTFKTIIAVLASAVALNGCCRQPAQLNEHSLFITEADAKIPYRIPAIATLSDGSMLALSD